MSDDGPEDITLRQLRALDAKLDQLAKDMAHGFATLAKLLPLPDPPMDKERAGALARVCEEFAGRLRKMGDPGGARRVEHEAQRLRQIADRRD